eukprot:Hpha_TRINITY_DN15735_c3_g1::TRINITY_DN15735_c3_g1_i1::g.41955::m.41955
MPKVVKVDIVSDIMCPWCWVGRRKLQQALDSLKGEVEARITWHPFLLRPSMPLEGVAKAPATPSNPRVGQRLREAGSRVGINFTGKCDVYPNTLAAHAALKWAGDAEARGEITAGSQDRLSEGIFYDYFTAGTAPTPENLAALAGRLGLDAAAVQRASTDRQVLDHVAREAAEHSRNGISGVPTFYFDGRHAFSGAQDPSLFIQEMRR